jgi:hypothetical protein
MAEGNVGLSERWFYLKSDLNRIEDDRLRRRGQPVDGSGDLISRARAAKEFRVPLSRIDQLIATGEVEAHRKDTFAERRRGETVYQAAIEKSYVSRRKVAKVLKHRQATKGEIGPDLILPSEASKLTERLAEQARRRLNDPRIRGFGLTTLWQWEQKTPENKAKEHPCPHLGRPLTVVRRPMCHPRTKGTKEVCFLRPNARYYTRPEVVTAFQNYLKLFELPPKTAGLKSVRGVHFEGSATYLTTTAAKREDGVHPFTLRNWAARGWLDLRKGNRGRPGRRDPAERVTFFRRDGEYGYLRLCALQKGRNHIPPDVAARLDAEAKARPAPRTEEAPSGSDTPNANGPGTSPDKARIDQPAPKACKKRGRKRGWRDPEVERRKTKMLEDWDRGEFDGNKAAAGKKYHFHKSDATKDINEHERAKGRK